MYNDVKLVIFFFDYYNLLIFLIFIIYCIIYIMILLGEIRFLLLNVNLKIIKSCIYRYMSLEINFSFDYFIGNFFI